MGRIQAIGEIDGRATTIAAVLDETIQFVDWTLSDADADRARVLTDLKQDLHKWHATIHTMWDDPAQRSLLCNQAGDWSERLVLASGLL
jgi:hypothetical protein